MTLIEKGVASLERVSIFVKLRWKYVEACASRHPSGYAPAYLCCPVLYEEAVDRVFCQMVPLLIAVDQTDTFVACFGQHHVRMLDNTESV